MSIVHTGMRSHIDGDCEMLTLYVLNESVAALLWSAYMFLGCRNVDVLTEFLSNDVANPFLVLIFVIMGSSFPFHSLSTASWKPHESSHNLTICFLKSRSILSFHLSANPTCTCLVFRLKSLILISYMFRCICIIFSESYFVLAKVT